MALLIHTFALLITVSLYALRAVGQAGDLSVAQQQTTPEIVVTAPRGSMSSSIGPLLELSPSELDAYDADSISDLVNALRPLTHSIRGDQMPVVLIDGHLAGQTELDILPREAIARVEVLPESVALQYGFSENQRVLDFVLRKHFSTMPIRATESGTTEGGGQAITTDGSLVRLNDQARATLLAGYKDNALLRDSDRGIEAPGSAYSTLQPSNTDTTVAATVNRSVLGVNGSFEVLYDALSARSLQGPALATGPTAGDIKEALGASTVTRSSRIALQLTGPLRDFLWDATAYCMHVRSKSASDLGINNTGDMLVGGAESSSNVGNLQLSVSGPVTPLPAGPVIANLKLGVQYLGYDSRDTEPGTPLAASHLPRSVRSVNINARIPIEDRFPDVLPAYGEIAGSLSASVNSVSDFGSLFSSSLGVDWQPLRKLHLEATYVDRRTAPTAEQLWAPPIYTRNVETFDYITQRTVYLTEISGGNDALVATTYRQGSFGVSFGPFAGKNEMLARYEMNRTANAIGALPPTTAAVESAFPANFARDADGNLIELDDRWVNLAYEQVDNLRWGVDVWVPIGASQLSGMARQIEFSLFDTWYTRDVTLLRAGIPKLNLLDGAPTGVSGGQPRHRVELHSLLHGDGAGILISVGWRSPTVVVSGEPEAPSPIYFSSLGTIDMKLFSDFEHLPWMRSVPWARGMRLSVAVTNLFDRRQIVRDADGATPAAFQPGFMDSLGRVLALTVRKAF